MIFTLPESPDLSLKLCFLKYFILGTKTADFSWVNEFGKQQERN